jgi:hypothetical protein
MYGEAWIFKGIEGSFACYPSEPALFFINNGNFYALNGYAADKFVNGKKASIKLDEILVNLNTATTAIAFATKACELK